ncbi:uncharacterized protein LOC128725607 [Anopheles nili]|uniref:uncharacterized protein LOC128725607 n=1 Tax=Anopheles nili TaxID=185578 RepID=UPI00237A71AF|nr:uncharacterized protein LOC128725607 [Anopheles nili]
MHTARQAANANKRNHWTREETLGLLDILRTSCLSYLDGSINNRKGQMYRQIQNEMMRRGAFKPRDPRQIEHKWKNLKFAYEKYKNEQGIRDPEEVRPCDYFAELEDLFDLVASRAAIMASSADEEITGAVTYYEEEFVADETEDLSVDEDAVVIEEIVYDSQDALDFAEGPAPSTSTMTKATPQTKRKKLTAENMNGLLLRISTLQKEHNDTFNRMQMELIENEFESFREKEKEHLLQLKLDLEVLKQKFLDRIQKIAQGDSPPDAGDETGAAGNEPKRRRIGAGVAKRK